MKPVIPENSFLKSIVDNTPAAYIVVDKEFNVIFANKYIVKIAGVAYQEILGKKCYQSRGFSSVCDTCIVAKAFETGKKEYRLNKEIDRAGNERYNDNYGVPLYKDDGTFEYVLEILTDRTEEMRYQKKLSDDFYRMLDTFVVIVEAKDTYTANHSMCVRDLSMLIAERLGLSDREKRDIYVAASLHDIGKIGIPDAVLNKTSKLNEEEFALIKTHPTVGVQLLSKLTSFDYLKGNIESHHEKMDGSGYPAGLAGNDIPIGARIIAVADAYDAMTSDRSYRKGMGHSKAAEELVFWSGKQFDPHIVSAFLDVCNVERGCDEGDNSILDFIEPSANSQFTFLQDFLEE